MSIVLNSANGSAVAGATDVIAAALLEIGVTAAGEAPSPEDAAWGLQKLQRAIDQHDARREMIFSVNFSLFNLIGNHAPHTIGPGGDFNVAVRPVTVTSASFILSSQSTNPVDSPIVIKDKDWWAANPTKSLTSAITTHLYYEPSAGLGTLNFWPICTVANPVRLETWSSLGQALTLQTQLAFVQGYWDAIVLDLAIKLWPSFKEQQPVPVSLEKLWNRAMRIIQANNEKPPRIDTDSGMPNSRRGGRPDFNFLTGLRE